VTPSIRVKLPLDVVRLYLKGFREASYLFPARSVGIERAFDALARCWPSAGPDPDTTIIEWRSPLVGAKPDSARADLAVVRHILQYGLGDEVIEDAAAADGDGDGVGDESKE